MCVVACVQLSDIYRGFCSLVRILGTVLLLLLLASQLDLLAAPRQEETTTGLTVSDSLS